MKVTASLGRMCAAATRTSSEYHSHDEHTRDSLSSSGPDLHGDHGLLGANGGKQVLLGQELKWKLDQEAADLLQLLAGAGGILLVQARFGQVDLQLQDVTDVAGRETPEYLEAQEETVNSTKRNLNLI